MQDPQQHLVLKAWAEDDRPREKLLIKGKAALTEAELIAILIASGNRKETAVELSRRILDTIKHDLHELARMSVKELCGFQGIGEAKAIAILAALELGKRRHQQAGLARSKISSSQDVADIFQPMLCDLLVEEFWILMLNRANLLIGPKKISEGGMTGTVADSKVIFRNALERSAVSIILCHNHPSGNLRPSEADLKLTKRLKEAGESIEIAVLDHLIVTQTGYFSFADEGLM